MVHRAPDSRLLSNLIVHEKEYTKHLAALFPISHTALASLSAYASASPSTNPYHLSNSFGVPGSSAAASPAQTVAAIVDVLAGADDALQSYNQAVETWREQLVSLKQLEDDLNAVLRDREILVTRLIKVSKSPKSSRDVRSSLLTNAGSGSASLSSLPSTNSTAAGSTNTKLGQAQTELQACEAHLAAKEQELEARRISVVRDGLGARCRALIDCGWVWGEMGKEGLRTLQAFSGVPRNGRAPKSSPGTHSPSPSRSIGTQKPLLSPALPSHLVNGPTSYSSDISSLTPSQSASQIAGRSVETSQEGPPVHDQAVQFTRVAQNINQNQSQSQRAPEPIPTRDVEQGDVSITLPPAHAVPELALPTGVWSQLQSQSQSRSISPHTLPKGNVVEHKKDLPDSRPAPRRKRSKHQRRPLSRDITEASDEDADADGLENGHASTTAHVILTSRFPTRGVRTDESASTSKDDSSDDGAAQGPLEVIENDPFGQTKRPSLSPSAAITGFEGDETSTPRPTLIGSALSKGKVRERRTSMAFFGSLRGLFRHKPKDHQGLTEWEGVGDTTRPAPLIRKKGRGGGGGEWVTRTDVHLKGSKGGGGSSDSELGTTVVIPEAPVSAVPPRVGGARLRKGRTSTVHPSSPSVPPVSTTASSSGWLTDGPVTASPRGNVKRKRKSVAELRGRDEGHTDGELERGDGAGAGDHINFSPGAGGGISSGGPSYRDRKRSPVPSHETSQRQQQPPPPTEPAAQTSSVHNIRSRVSSLSRASVMSAPAGTIPTPRSHARSATMDFSGTRCGSNVLNGSSPGAPRRSVSIAYGPSEPVHSHPATVDAQDTSSATKPKPKRNARRGTLHMPHIANGNASQSLMSIVEDVARQNREGWGAGATSVQPLPNGIGTQLVNLGSGRLQVPRAPSLVVPFGERGLANASDKQTRSLDLPRAPGSASTSESQSWPTQTQGHRRTSSSPPTSRVGSPSIISATPTPSATTADGPASSPRPAKSPLRSALRNSSRTPSPSPAQLVEARGRIQEVVRPQVGVVDERCGETPDRDSRPLSPPSPPDSASISSYATGRESFEVEPEATLSSPPATHSYSSPLPPLPPPHSDQVPDPPSSNVSTETPPVRRKSVRVSLHPTFSPTPPALYDNDEEAYALWSKPSSSVDGVGWKKRNEHVPDSDLWQDSSEEDEEYSRARRLLSRVGKRDKRKGKV
ncbi:hypothetical protein BS17DRAFT_756261 [Gyrodon lividus]|nr:hypothetical protein BS17DRAFT_756261 [Gyrodon lividus]